MKKQEYLVVYSSITRVMRVKRIMESYGESTYIIATPKSIPVNDCSYSLRIKSHNLNLVLRISKEEDLKIKGIYKEIGNNEYEKVVF